MEYDPLLPDALRRDDHGVEEAGGGKPRVDVLRAFPIIFTFGCMLLFLPPLVKCISVAFDPDYLYWCGRSACLYSFIPCVLIALVHLRNEQRGEPSRVAVVLALVGSSCVWLIIATNFMSQGDQSGMRLSAEDCRSFAFKYQLEQSWEQANDFMTLCKQQHFAELHFNPSIVDCPGYSEAETADWRYLAFLEMRHACGGFCTAGPQLWAFGGGGERCSRAVADVMLDKVYLTGLELMFYSVSLFAFAGSGLVFAGPRLRALGVDW
mmetsp:Transcript_129317/g.258206  ORF Transcript_129317/g.258206 Transcript_129317/m.258206 type:complete len:265 (+) Transcript_129317:108-902(+)|eukprot:CAMPEP_0172682800 /NCGR_PEP_ID=MMETSP1074-20121228/18409_1 /TAXON_ID=2916 /ORGANISM="Ceratium fusus, Strain PA161109" /LENGTH=264 /DNA_ID=CAMNT_0013501537 /DNA_START=89 /DNA_END=880 /DNA_ORIENTATION=-